MDLKMLIQTQQYGRIRIENIYVNYFICNIAQMLNAREM